ncbi:hypothetical protein FB45DRAFT_918992 [Roridomyces roridus]|uniref:Uncharacterized protein n=1 Tax=Roridomyces roridus TaxID=1738132 RepID=A0AAD7BRD4_9AGAR|nr:hypothetical protein FB45DRAFT_918992 [Roridomyces roridus]
MSTPPKPLHENVDLAIADCIQQVSPRFSLYLDDGGMGSYIDPSDLVALEETALVGEVSLTSALADFALCKGIPIEHYAMVSSRILHPNTFSAMVEHEPIRFCSNPTLLENATPAMMVTVFAGLLRIFLGSEGVREWLAVALGEAVHAAAHVCVSHAQSLEEDPSQAQGLRQNGRQRIIARLTAVAEILKTPEGPETLSSSSADQAPVVLRVQASLAELARPKSTGHFSSGGVAKLWLSNAHKFAAGVLSIARSDFKGFKPTTFVTGATGNFFRRGKALLFKSPSSSPSSPCRSRRSRAPSPDSPSKFHPSSALVPWTAPDLSRVSKRRKVSDVSA